MVGRPDDDRGGDREVCSPDRRTRADPMLHDSLRGCADRIHPDLRIAAYPEYARIVALDEAAAGIDLFIGSAEHVNRGLGAPLIAEFLRTIVFDDPEVESCVIGPAAGNRAAIRAYEKVGFQYIKTVKAPDELEPEYLMRIARSALLAAARHGEWHEILRLRSGKPSLRSE